MINKDEFELPELEEKVAFLQKMQDKDELSKVTGEAFNAYDTDKNGHLDRAEMRHFLEKMFTDLKIHFPLTDEFIDDIFRAIDEDHNNEISVEELTNYTAKMTTEILPLFEKALADKKAE